VALSQEIRGDVRGKDSGQPLADVLVRCSGTGGISDQVTTRDGKFYFRVSPGQYTVSVQASGYEAAEQSITLTDFNASEYMAFRLKLDAGARRSIGSSVINANIPSEAQKEFDKAELAAAKGSKEGFEEAVIHYAKAVSIFPTFLQAQLKLGTTYMDLQQWEKAEPALKRALEIDPKAVNAAFALGELYLRQKKYDQAQKAVEAGFVYETRSAQAHLTLAKVYWEKVAGVKEEAQWRPSLEKSYEEVKQALALDPNLAAAHLLKGNLLFKVRRAEDAMHEYEEYLRLDPQGAFAPQTRTLVEKIKKALSEQKKP
jgi:tetratricopeptide (TPR) repeat protein